MKDLTDQGLASIVESMDTVLEYNIWANGGQMNADELADMDRLEFEMRVLRKYGYEIPEQLNDEYNAASRRYSEACWKMDMNNY